MKSDQSEKMKRYKVLKLLVFAGLGVLVVSTLILISLVAASNYVEATVSGIKVGTAKEADVDKSLWLFRKGPSDIASLPDDYLKGLQDQITTSARVVSYSFVAYEAAVIFDSRGLVAAIYVD